MAQYQGSYGQQAARSSQAAGAEGISGWAVGFTFFASMMMMLIGGFHIIAGLAAIFEDAFYVVRPGYDLEMDVTTWGWIHFVGGIVVVLAGIGLITGSFVSRLITIFIAALSIIWNFYSIPYYPVWSILMIALGVGVIWALTAHGHDLDVASE
jgi:hypothetical protein